MAQEDNNKLKPNFSGRNNDDRGTKKPPRFNIYWVYALIAILLIGYQFMNITTADSSTISFQEFKQKMLLPGDVEKLEQVTNKKIVRVYIVKDSLNKPIYQEKRPGISPNSDIKGPLFDFKVTDWEAYETSIHDFYKEHPEVKEVDSRPNEEGEWFGPIAQTVLTVLLFVGLWVLLMRKVGGPGGGGGGRRYI
jgi:cell division protease FtsH